jgi:hypothetical protein
MSWMRDEINAKGCKRIFLRRSNIAIARPLAAANRDAKEGARVSVHSSIKNSDPKVFD